MKGSKLACDWETRYGVSWVQQQRYLVAFSGNSNFINNTSQKDRIWF